MADQQGSSLLDQILALGKEHIVQPLVSGAKSDVQEIKEKGIPLALARGLYYLPYNLQKGLMAPYNTAYDALGISRDYDPMAQPGHVFPNLLWNAMTGFPQRGAAPQDMPQRTYKAGQNIPKPGVQEQGGMGDPFFTGQWPTLPQAPTAPQVSAPDFSAARRALGSKPNAPEAIPRGEQLARVLGGAAQGALQGVRSGGTAGAVLAGAGGGTGSVLGEIRREEEARQQDYRDRLERHQTNLARLESMAANAKSENDRYVANMQYQGEMANWQLEVADARARAPKVNVTYNGIVTVQQVDKNGKFTVHVVDTQQELKMMIAAAKASGKDKTLYMGEVVDSSALTAQQKKLADIANDVISGGAYLQGDFRDMLDAVLDEYFGGLSIDDLNGAFASGQLDEKQYYSRLQQAVMVTAGRLAELQIRQSQGQSGRPVQ